MTNIDKIRLQRETDFKAGIVRPLPREDGKEEFFTIELKFHMKSLASYERFSKVYCLLERALKRLGTKMVNKETLPTLENGIMIEWLVVEDWRVPRE